MQLLKVSLPVFPTDTESQSLQQGNLEISRQSQHRNPPSALLDHLSLQSLGAH